MWILARHGEDTALVTPWGYAFSTDQDEDLKAYIYTDRPVYRPGHTVHIKACDSQGEERRARSAGREDVNLKVTDADGKAVLSRIWRFRRMGR